MKLSVSITEDLWMMSGKRQREKRERMCAYMHQTHMYMPFECKVTNYIHTKCIQVNVHIQYIHRVRQVVTTDLKKV